MGTAFKIEARVVDSREDNWLEEFMFPSASAALVDVSFADMAVVDLSEFRLVADNNEYGA